jgi:antitoxin component YwqK of YwqJK toxin-antitoxin module
MRIKHLLLSIIFIFVSQSLIAQSTLNQLDSNGKRHGVWKKLYKNGNKRYVGQFEHGKEVGTFNFYAVTGEEHPMVIKEFTKESNFVDVRYFTNKGILESQGKMDGKNRIGNWIYYFSDGKTILSNETYKEGLLDGEAKTFYKDGKLAEIAHYKAGKLHGNRIRYSDEGKPTENLTYEAGTMHGPAIIYDEKGELYARGSYENGIKSGEWEFNMDGEMVKTQAEEILKK